MQNSTQPSKIKQATTISQVISMLDEIILDSETKQNPLGYFAALYRKVTQKVKEGIAENYFDDGPRMEKLDVVFANRYIAAYYAYQAGESVTDSWKCAFGLSTQYWPIVLQHLLIGMNAHINLDLGIAAAEIMQGRKIDNLEADFNKINEVLSSLVHDLQQDLAVIWPTLGFILKWTGKFDDLLTDFSMKLARDGAWKFATSLADKPTEQWDVLIKDRDQKVARNAGIVSNPGIVISTVFAIIRLGEKGSISERIGVLSD